MPNYIDYSTEDVNGTPVHTFTDASGVASPALYGAEADQLASSIDRNKQFAQANAGPAMSVDPNAPNQSVGAPPSPPQLSVAPAPSYSQTDVDAARTQQTPFGPPVAPPATPEEQQAAAEAAQVQQIHSAAAGGNPMAGQLDPGAYVNRPVRTAGVSREQLQHRAAGAVAIPKTGEETVEGAAPYDENAADARAQASLDLRLAKQQAADLLQQRAERDAAIFDQQAASAAVRIQHEQQKQQLIEDGVATDAAHARDFRDQVAKQQVDPGRLFSGDRGAFNTVAAVIGQALGAFAAAGGGSPTVNGRRAAAGGQNYAKQIIDGAIDRDIRAQEVNIRSNQDMANNQLNDIYKRLGDMNQAKSVLRSMQTDYAGLQMKALAARDGSEDAANAFAQWDAANAQDRAEQERKFLADSYGKHTVKVATRFSSPQAGGSRMPTEAEIQQRIGTQQKLGELGVQGRKQEAELGNLESQATKNRAEADKAQNPQNNPAAQEYGKSIQFVDSAQSAYEQAVTKAGGTYDKQTGEVTWKPGSSVPGAGVVSRMFGWHSDDAKGLESTVNGNAAAIEKGIEGDAAGEAGIKQIKESLTTGNEASRRAAFEAYGKTLAARRQSVDAGVDPKLRAARAGNATSAAVQRLQQQQQGTAAGGGVRQQ